MRTLQLAGLTLALVALAVHAAPAAAQRSKPDRAGVQKATLVATDDRFTPSTLHAIAGQPLEITIINRGTHVHGLRLVLSYGEVPFPENVPPGRTMSRTFENLGEPGTRRFYCPVDDHASRGMQGALIVGQR